MPRMPDFIGGSDVQRSPNLSDNKLINLYPVLNDKGDRAALIATPGLSIYAAIPNGTIATGPGTVTLLAGVTTMTIQKDYATANGWTGSGGRACKFATLIYEI